MKIQCIVCEAAEAAVLCCADEAALCWGCDRNVHGANKLAGKHQRISLSAPSSPQKPICDVCKESSGYFFCLEDRALLCRKCDVAIHKANPIVSSHKRYLLTGVRVGLEASEAHSPSSLANKTQANGKFSKPKSRSIPNGTSPVSSNTDQGNKTPLVQAAACNDFPSPNLHISGGLTRGGMSQWHLDDIIGVDESTQNYNFMDGVSSKSDSKKLGDPCCSDILRIGDGNAEIIWSVPRITPLPTSSHDPSCDASLKRKRHVSDVSSR